MMNLICFLLFSCCVVVLYAHDDMQTDVTTSTELIVNGYIPLTIAPDITRVTVLDLNRTASLEGNMLIVNSSMFSDNSWKNVRYLALTESANSKIVSHGVTLTDKCFIHLTHLEELLISVLRTYLLGETFHGLVHLSALTVSGCQRIHQTDVERALSSAKSVPNLRYLDISNNWGQSGGHTLAVDQKFLTILFSKPLKGINLSFNALTFIDGVALSQSCDELEYLNVSGCSFGPVNNSLSPWCESIGIVDLSYTTLRPLFKNYVKFRFTKDVTFSHNIMHSIQYSKMKDVRADGIMNGVDISGGATVTCQTPPNYRTLWTSLSLRQNKLKRFDCKLVYIDIAKLTRLDLSQNELEFIHPQFFNFSWQSLQYLDLSNNKLHLMVIENEMSFSQIAKSYPNLRNFGLAANQFSYIPESMFKYNQFLEKLDLSNNKLSTFRLLFSRQNHLRELDLSNNNFVTLDVHARQILSSLPVSNNGTVVYNVRVTLDSNPISCSVCEDYVFIDWTLRSLMITTEGFHSVSCIDGNGNRQLIHQNTADSLQNVCKENIYRRNTIIVASVFSVSFLLVTLGIVFYIVRYMKAKKHKKEIEDSVALIQNDARQHAVFLSFCSDDEDFVNDHVFTELNNTLQELMETDRTLVSTGDRNFRLGLWIPDETVNTLTHASVVIIVVSDAYCQSGHCRREFEQAYDLRKPIMLMYKGHVQEDLMFPVMREHYNRYTRILWEENDGDYRLKTSWLNVGTSILDMLAN